MKQTTPDNSLLLLENLFNNGVFFVLPEFNDQAPRGSNHPHQSVALAEGFQAMGIPLYGNRNCWLQSLDTNNYLIPAADFDQVHQCALCIIDVSLLGSEQGPTDRLKLIAPFVSTDTLTVLIDASDPTIFHPEFDQFPLVFRTHMSRFVKYPSNYVPWAFGLSNRIITSTASSPPFQERAQEILINFRASANQSVRVALEFTLVPHLSNVLRLNRTVDLRNTPITIDNSTPFDFLCWTQVGGRHNPNYYNRLKNSIACCAYGGTFVYGDLGPGILRWDSWRFWESLAAGCVSIHLDLQKYGLLLPIMPENWKHYIGIDLANLEEINKIIQKSPHLLEHISTAGQQWALEHYSPVPTACYFLDIIFSEQLGTTQNLLQLLTVTAT